MPFVLKLKKCELGSEKKNYLQKKNPVRFFEKKSWLRWGRGENWMDQQKMWRGSR